VTSGHELDAPPWLRVESTIMATARAIRQCYDQRFADLGLNLSEASLLAFVEESGPLTQTRLAQRLGLGRAATGSVIDSLEKRGLVERQPDPDDRRVWLVTVTRAGKDLVEQVNASDQVLRSELRAGISRADRQQLAALLVRLQENLAAALDDGRSSTGGPGGP
jgi:MarR family transcriptional regulator, transcriptional regulator for hemolysin